MALSINQGQHNSRSPSDIGFCLCFVKCNSFGNSGICISTSKWDPCMYMYRTF